LTSNEFFFILNNHKKDDIVEKICKTNINESNTGKYLEKLVYELLTTKSICNGNLIKLNEDNIPICDFLLDKKVVLDKNYLLFFKSYGFTIQTSIKSDCLSYFSLYEVKHTLPQENDFFKQFKKSILRNMVSNCNLSTYYLCNLIYNNEQVKSDKTLIIKNKFENYFFNRGFLKTNFLQIYFSLSQVLSYFPERINILEDEVKDLKTQVNDVKEKNKKLETQVKESNENNQILKTDFEKMKKKIDKLMLNYKPIGKKVKKKSNRNLDCQMINEIKESSEICSSSKICKDLLDNSNSAENSSEKETNDISTYLP
jgi:hypothetical protein